VFLALKVAKTDTLASILPQGMNHSLGENVADSVLYNLAGTEGLLEGFQKTFA
jgi:hypothetical protein